MYLCLARDEFHVQQQRYFLSLLFCIEMTLHPEKNSVQVNRMLSLGSDFEIIF